MTIEEIKKSDKEYLLATDVAGILQVDPSTIRFMAHTDPELLGFATVAYRLSERSQTWHVKIPRMAFLYWLKYGKTPLMITGLEGQTIA